MGRSKLWLIVEGRVHDRPFYDRLLESHWLTVSGGYTVRLAEQIEVDGVAAGGKRHLEAIMELYEAEDLLRQQNRRGTNRIAFALDRDFDGHGSQGSTGGAHQMYTTMLDVEAEILLNGDLRRSVSSAYSIAREDVSDDLADGRALATSLAKLWRDWIVMALCCVSCGVEAGVRHASVSKIHAGGFGALDSAKRDAMVAQIEARLSTEEDRQRYADAQIKADAILGGPEPFLLVKGKWIASYVSHLIRELPSDMPVQANVPADVLSKACLETLDFGAPWVAQFHTQLDLIHAS